MFCFKRNDKRQVAAGWVSGFAYHHGEVRGCHSDVIATLSDDDHNQTGSAMLVATVELLQPLG